MARGGGGCRASPHSSSGGWGVPCPDPALRWSQRLSSSWSLLEEDIPTRRRLGSSSPLEEGEISGGGVDSSVEIVPAWKMDEGCNDLSSADKVKGVPWSSNGILAGYRLMLANRVAVKDPGAFSRPTEGSGASPAMVATGSYPPTALNFCAPTVCQNASESCTIQNANDVLDHSLVGTLKPSLSKAITPLQQVSGLCRSSVLQPRDAMAMNAHNGSAGYSFGAREGVGDGVQTVSLSETGVVSFDAVQTESITATGEALVNCHNGEDLGAISHLEVGSNTAPVMAAAGDEASASRGDGNGTGAGDESCAKTPNEPRVMSGFGTSTGTGAAPASVTSSPPTTGDDVAAAYAFDVGVPVHLDSAGELV